MNISQKHIDRFWSKVNIGKESDCWEWHAAVSHNGYGQCTVDGESIRAHRFSYILAHGDIPAGMNVCRKCDNPRCVNPAHLWVGTQADNIRDRQRKGRSKNIGRAGRNALAATQVAEIRNRFVAGGVSYAALAREYGVSRSTTRRIVLRITCND